MIVLGLADVQARLDLDTARAAVRDALVAAARGAATPPAVMHLDLGAGRGDLHVKGAWLHGAPTFAIKVAGSFAGAAAQGLPPVQGLSLVLDATTGAPLALLDDGGWLTEVRTGAAGAVAVEALAPAEVGRLAVLGTGGQARHQLDAIARVRRPREVAVWGRRPEAAERVRAHAESLGLAAVAVAYAEEAVGGADVVVTVTAARAPLFAAGAAAATALVVAVGADTPGKQELDPALLEQAGLVVADDVRQCREQGELQHARPDLPAVALGALLAGDVPRPARPGAVVVDLTGLGVQDAAVAGLVLGSGRLSG